MTEHGTRLHIAPLKVEKMDGTGKKYMCDNALLRSSSGGVAHHIKACGKKRGKHYIQ